MDRFTQALSFLLPTGYAWPRDPDSVLMRVLRGVAAAFTEAHDFMRSTAEQWLPHLTSARLAEWEDATGLPDGCFGAVQTVAIRRQLLLARLRGPTGYYPDSSPAAPGAIEAICANLGYTATVRYNTPFRCARDRVGDRLGALDGKLYVHVVTETEPFRVLVGRAGARLIERTLPDAKLACYLARVVPARYEVIVIYL